MSELKDHVTRLNKENNQLRRIIEGYSDGGMWGRTAFRLQKENKKLKESVTKIYNLHSIYHKKHCHVKLELANAIVDAEQIVKESKL